jgi:hypothetical protein
MKYLVVAVLVCVSSAALSEELDTQKIKSVVKACVAAVHVQYGSDLFDAFYNPATQMVENNVTTQGQLPFLYNFRKCMAEQGYPLTGSSQ